jgi:hypothetical protein
MKRPKTSAAERIAEILIPEGIDRKGKPSRIATAYGSKTRAGLAELIDSETAAPDMAKALEGCIQSLQHMPETDGAYKYTCIAQAKAALTKAGYTF